MFNPQLTMNIKRLLMINISCSSHSFSSIVKRIITRLLVEEANGKPKMQKKNQLLLWATDFFYLYM